MNLFLDTSSLFKLHHREEGTDRLYQIISDYNIEKILLSQLALIEYDSALWKKVRTKEIPAEACQEDIKQFNLDREKYIWIELNLSLLSAAKTLLARH